MTTGPNVFPLRRLAMAWAAMIALLAVGEAWAETIYESYDFTHLSINAPTGLFPSIFPRGLVMDASGTFFLLDGFNRVFKVTPDGVATLLAGSDFGFSDGSGPAAKFGSPSGIVRDSAGNLLVADTANHVIRKITPAGVVTTVAGTPTISGYLNGPALSSHFYNPNSIAIDAADNVYITDASNVIRKLTPNGIVSLVAGTPNVEGTLDGPAAAATFQGLSGIVVDASGNIFVTQLSPSVVRKISASGIVTTIAGSLAEGNIIDSFADGPASVAKFRIPRGLALDAAGNLFVMDSGNAAVRKITPGGSVTTLAGRPNSNESIDGAGAGVSFLNPVGIAVDRNGLVYLADGDPSAPKIRIGGPAGTFFEPNDLFTRASVLAGASATATGNNVRATAETGEPDHAGNVAAKSLWWEWTATSFGRLTLTTAGSSFDTVLSIYTGPDLTHLALIGENDDAAADHTSRISIFVVPGTTYKIAVDGYNGASGNINLALSFAATSTIYSTDFENFPGGANWLGGFDGWYATNVKDGVQGIYPDVSGSAAARIGYSPTADAGVYVLRPVNFDPVAANASVVEFTTDVAIIDSTNGIRDNFHFLLYNLSDALVAGLNFDNTDKQIYRYDGDKFNLVGQFVPGTRYPLFVSMNFATHQWSAKLGSTTLFTDQPMSAKGGLFSLGHLGAYWEITTKGSPGNNYMTFDNYKLKLSDSLPLVVTPPRSLTVATGASAVFTVEAQGDGLHYQWSKDGVTLSGATTAGYMIPNVAPADAGSYRVTLTGVNGTAASSAASLTVINTVDVGRLVNLSVRTHAGSGATSLLTGFVTGGAQTVGTKPLLIRAAGPTLANFGVSGALANPAIEIIPQGSTVAIAANDDWAGDAEVSTVGAAVGAFPFVSSSSRDAALVLTPAAGAYSVRTLGGDGANDITLVEIYDALASSAFASTSPRLLNVSARAQVDTDDGILICGFVVGGSTARTVLIRGIGPRLAQFGVTGALKDPSLQLYQRINGTDVLVASNDDWGLAPNKSVMAGVAAQVGAFSIFDDSKDSVLLLTLPPGVYSAQLSGTAKTTGVGLLEVYEVP